MGSRSGRWLGSVASVLLGLLVVGVGPHIAAAADVVMYEITEHLKDDSEYRMTENATLIGKARVGTPVYTQQLVDAVSPGATSCTIIAYGWDKVHKQTGLGEFGGSFVGVVDADNPFDGPEAVVMTGKFQGEMDSSPVRQTGHPYGTITGKLTVDGLGDFPIRGIFRMPFLGSAQPYGSSGPTLRQLLCPDSPEPNPHVGGFDFAYVDTTDAGPNGRCIDIQPPELSIATPTPRFEISF